MVVGVLQMEAPPPVVDPLASKGWSAIAKREAAVSLSDRSKSAAIVKGIKL